jgi:SNF2 family DNA or RNA helicase
VNLIQRIDPTTGRDIALKSKFFQPDQYQQMIAHLYLRRTRDEVLTELPELSIINEWVSFSPEGYEEYRSALSRKNFHHARRAAWMTSSSSKLERLVELCEEAISNHQKIVIYSFYLDVIQTLYNTFKESAVTPITGSVSSKKRQHILDTFEHTKTKYILISQVTTGGQGINLHFANIVVLCEPQWKPSTESQAIARVHRMGQVNRVLVYRLLTEESVDEYVLAILESKSEIFERFANPSLMKELANASSTSLQDHILAEEIKRHEVTPAQVSV